MFKVGDKICFVAGDNPEIMTVDFVWDDAVWGGYCGEIYKNHEVRHATPEEIAAGHRIDLEDLRDCDTSPNCKKYER